MRQVYSIARRSLRNSHLQALLWRPHQALVATTIVAVRTARCFSAAPPNSRPPLPPAGVDSDASATTTITSTPTQSATEDLTVDPEILPHVKRCDRHDEDPFYQNDSTFHLYFLGTGSGTCGYRHPSCTLLRLGSEGLLFDAGEGAQRHVKQSNIRMKKISRIFITHMHGDHVMGLPGLLLSTNLAQLDEEDSTLRVYGPPGIYNFITTSLSLTHSKLRMAIEVYELVGGDSRTPWQRRGMMGEFPQFRHNKVFRRTIKCGNDGVWTIKEFEKVTKETDFRRNDFRISAAEIRHVPNVQTFGFVVEEKTPAPKLDPQRAKDAGVGPSEKYSELKLGFPVMNDEGTREVQPHEVLVDNPYKGRKLALLGDTCGVPPLMARLCRGADVLVHEATLLEEDREHCVPRGHSTPSMAGKLANLTNASLLVLNHHGGRLAGESQEPSREAEKVVQGGKRVISAYDFLEIVVPREGFDFTDNKSGPVSEGSDIHLEDQVVKGSLLPPHGLLNFQEPKQSG